MHGTSYYDMFWEFLLSGVSGGKIKKPKKAAKRLVKAFRYLERIDKATLKRGERQRSQSARLSGQ